MGMFASTEFWTVAAGVIALITFIFMYFTHRGERFRSRKMLLVHETTWSNITHETTRIDGKPLHVFLGKEPVRNFAICLIRVANVGGASIVKHDFETSITVRYTDIDKIYYTNLRGRTSQSLSPEIDIAGNDIIIKPLLLNPGDSFDIEAGFDVNSANARPALNAFGRIAGISEICVIGGPKIDATGVSKITLPKQPDTAHLLRSAILGLAGGITLAVVLAVIVFNTFADKRTTTPPVQQGRPPLEH
jgi:hypothetical protein